jgi:7-cyano-7-deazaguanine synthase
MKIVTLVSGGLDSTLVACLAKELRFEQFPLFLDYGQRARDKELAACRRSLKKLGLPPPKIAALPGFGKLIQSGLTSRRLNVFEDAFTPGRNTLFLLVAASYASQVKADAVAIGLLDERLSLFPDQTQGFIRLAEKVLALAVDRQIQILAPLFEFSKADVVALARVKGLNGTYSCHLGQRKPCGVCIACKEFQFEEA